MQLEDLRFPSALDFSVVFNALPGDNVLLLPDLTIVAVSDDYLRATWTTREAIVGRPIFEVFADNPDDPTAEGGRSLRLSLEAVLRDRSPHKTATQKYDIRLPEARGGGLEERFWDRLDIPILGSTGEVVWILHHVADVTELVRRSRALEDETAARVKAEDALRQAQKMEAIGQLTGGIAHDFNNLLTVVGGSLDLLRRDSGDPARVVRLADSALMAVERCETLIKQLLMFARRQILRPETVNLNTLISEFEATIGRVTTETVDLKTRLSPVLYPTRVDPTQFGSAILNLIMNAREAINGPGHIVIETENIEIAATVDRTDEELAPGSYAMVAVSDTGRGIPKELLGRVFDPFVTTKEVGKGSGLGLSQVYGFAKESGGQVKITSEPGVGTTVRLFLPRSTDRRVEDERRVDGVPLGPSRDGETVLVVEDDRPVLDMAVQGLRGLGYRVLIAENAVIALSILKGDDSINILFSDVVMPGGMNGVQLAVEARRLRPELKVLLTSGYTASTLASQHGLNHDLPILEKPYKPQELANRFRSILSVDKVRPLHI
jgi:signal transduction histidine kinase